MKTLEHPVVLFDGVCNFCNGVVNFLIRQDRHRVLRFAAMQSEAGIQLLQQHGLGSDYLRSFVLIINGRVYKKSTAALKVYRLLPWYWQWTQIFWIVPRFLRDAVYEFIAGNRYQWFGKREQCRVPTPELRSRFLE